MILQPFCQYARNQQVPNAQGVMDTAHHTFIVHAAHYKYPKLVKVALKIYMAK